MGEFAANMSKGKSVIIRSPSSDVAIVVLFIADQFDISI